MKTTIIKETSRSKSRTTNRNKVIKTKLLKSFSNEGTGVSHQSDDSIEAPHQARPSAESRGESFNDQLEYMKYRIFETIKDIKP